MATKRKHSEARELNIEIEIKKHFENVNLKITVNDEGVVSCSGTTKVVESNSHGCNLHNFPMDDTSSDLSCQQMDEPMKSACVPTVAGISETNVAVNGCTSPNLPATDLSCQQTSELMTSALNSVLIVDALETIPALKKKCARLGINGNFGYRRTAREMNKCGMYAVERILDHDTENHLYLIKWKGYGTEFNTWEPIDHLSSISGLVYDFRLMERSLSEDNKIAYKKLILLSSLLEEITSPANKDPYVLLKLTGKSVSKYKPADLANLKHELKSKSKCLRDAIIGDEQFGSDYCGIFERTINDLRIVAVFESVDKLKETLSARKKFIKCLKIREANINRLILKEEGCATIEIENNCDADLLPEDFTYITKCRTGSPDVIISQEPCWFCNCKQYCNSKRKKCCPAVNGSHDSYDKDGSLKNMNQPTIFECNSKCNCPPTCKNRVIQKGRKVCVPYLLHVSDHNFTVKVSHSLSSEFSKRKTDADGE